MAKGTAAGHAVSVTTMDAVGGSTAAELGSIRRRLWAHALVANAAGITVVLAFLVFLFPVSLPPEQFESVLQRALPAFATYLALSVPAGAVFIEPRFREIDAWIASGRPATDTERALVLGFPRRWAMVSVTLWTLGGLLFGALLGDQSPAVLVRGGIATIVLGGLTSSTLQYLVIERIMRPVAARALADGTRVDCPRLGVTGRLVLTWALATGIPVAGIADIAAQDLLGTEYDSTRVVGAVLALAVVALAVGLAATVISVRAVADPLISIRGALAAVEAGDYDTRVPVDDGTEIGLLEAGFNRMASGLAERERLRHALGTFVDPALADRVLTEGTDLAGEDVEVSLLFLDIRGFTAFSERADARAVVMMLNDLFGVVVPVVLRHGGHANKFIGDGLLAVFGAPERHEDHADRAVAAALEIAELVRVRYAGELSVGIGVNSGKVVVGTVGGGGRLDFTVIGDAVNTAARVESATRQTGDDVLVTEHTLRLLTREHAPWRARPSVPLKGKTEELTLYGPGDA